MIPNLRHPRTYVSLLVLSLLILIPLGFNSPFVYHLFVLICVYGALSTAWNLVGGFAGQMSLWVKIVVASIESEPRGR